MTVNCWVFPAGKMTDVGSIVIRNTSQVYSSSRDAMAVKLLTAAVIWAVPEETAVANPLLSTVTTFVFEDK
ncbi:hypothetical protein STZ1_540001 [Bacillus subtilis]